MDCARYVGRCMGLALIAVLMDTAGLILFFVGVFASTNFWDFLVFSGTLLIFLSLVFWILWYLGNIEVSLEELRQAWDGPPRHFRVDTAVLRLLRPDILLFILINALKDFRWFPFWVHFFHFLRRLFTGSVWDVWRWSTLGDVRTIILILYSSTNMADEITRRRPPGQPKSYVTRHPFARLEVWHRGGRRKDGTVFQFCPDTHRSRSFHLTLRLRGDKLFIPCVLLTQKGCVCVCVMISRWWFSPFVKSEYWPPKPFSRNPSNQVVS